MTKRWGALGAPQWLVSLLVGGVAAVLVLYPIAYLVQASLSVGDPQARPPEAYGLDNYLGLGRYGHIFGNTLFVAAAATALAVFVDADRRASPRRRVAARTACR